MDLPPARALARSARTAAWGLAAIAGLSLPSPARAAEFTPTQRQEIVGILRDALTHDPTILRDAVTAMQAEEARHQQASTQAAIAAQRMQLVGSGVDAVAGNPAGDVTIVEFFDTRCPYCRHLEPDMDALLSQDHGVRLVFKDLPILGASSMLGAHALMAAQRQDGYVKLRTALMAPGAPTSRDGIGELATHVGLDSARLLHDMDDPAIGARIEGNLHLAQSLGIQGTPAMVVGNTLVPGAVTLADLKQAISAARATR